MLLFLINKLVNNLTVLFVIVKKAYKGTTKFAYVQVFFAYLRKML